MFGTVSRFKIAMNDQSEEEEMGRLSVMLYYCCGVLTFLTVYGVLAEPVIGWLELPWFR